MTKTFDNLIDNDVINCKLKIGDSRYIDDVKFYVRITQGSMQLRRTSIDDPLYFDITNDVCMTYREGKYLMLYKNGCIYQITLVNYVGNLIEDPELIGIPF